MKHLCDLNKKGYDKVAEKVVLLVNDPRFICKKCLRVANSDERLCKPVILNSHK